MSIPAFSSVQEQSTTCLWLGLEACPDTYLELELLVTLNRRPADRTGWTFVWLLSLPHRPSQGSKPVTFQIDEHMKYCPGSEIEPAVLSSRSSTRSRISLHERMFIAAVVRSQRTGLDIHRISKPTQPHPELKHKEYEYKTMAYTRSNFAA